MRNQYISVAALGAALALTACGGDAEGDSAPAQLVVVGQGGGYDEAHKIAAEPFEEEHNVEIEFQPGANTQGLVLSRGGDVDMLLSQPLISFQGEKEGLWAELDSESVPNATDLYDVAQLSDQTKVHDFGAYVYAYDPEQVDTPTEWSSIWEDQYCGTITMPDFTNPVIILTTHMAEENGGSLENMDPGFEKMEDISSCVHTWWDSNDQVEQLFRSGEVSTAITTSARALEAQENGIDLEYVLPDPGALAMMTTVNVVEDSDNRDLALAYADHLLDPETQAVFAENMPYMPSNVDGFDMVDSETQEQIGFTPEEVEDFIAPDFGIVETVIEDWRDEWNQRIHG